MLVDLAAELANSRFDDTHFLGNALALFFGDLPVWWLEDERALALRMAT